jgi:hypothetical protein
VWTTPSLAARAQLLRQPCPMNIFSGSVCTPAFRRRLWGSIRPWTRNTSLPLTAPACADHEQTRQARCEARRRRCLCYHISSQGAPPALNPYCLARTTAHPCIGLGASQPLSTGAARDLSSGLIITCPAAAPLAGRTHPTSHHTTIACPLGSRARLPLEAAGHLSW